ncbi:MAG: exodeoxyribonuclease V subunit gamma [Pseudomonadota bacterium]
MFKIFKSNKMENLMDVLVSVLQQVPDNPMQPEWIGIQSKGMKQWIMLQTAEKLGVCANMNFVFPRQMVDYILAGFKPLQDLKDQSDRADGLNQDVLFWSILKQIKENPDTRALAGIAKYIQSDTTGKKQTQLALKMAKVFDDYQIYRPGMLLDWQQDKVSSQVNDTLAVWQAELWKAIAPKAHHHLPGNIELFLNSFSSDKLIKNHLPGQMSLFGVSALPVQFLQVFNKISNIMDINLFFLVPSNQYFFDIQSQKQLDKIALKTQNRIDPELLYYEMTNPLLSSLGSSIKGFCSILEAYDYVEPDIDLFCDPVNENTNEKPDPQKGLLNYLQSDILNLVNRKTDHEDKPILISDQDRSVQIHACHSPMRETQVLKDLLLDEFEKDPDLAPHDVIVMMPDIESYAPFIESCFSLENALPFAISDRRKKSESEVLNSFLKLLALKNLRFERGQVLDLLLSESIARKFKITPDEISKIEQMVTDAGILWGKNARHRESLGLSPFEENTWEFGLNRLFMGMAMAQNHDDLVAGVLPCYCLEGLELEALGKLSAFCHALFTRMDEISKNMTIEQWCRELKKMIYSLMERNDQNSEDFGFLFQTIDQMSDDALAADFSDKLSPDIIFTLIEQKLDLSIAHGNFMAGNITFCNIMPMRSIPFKIVVLMGMDEKSFPRKTFGPGFDLIKKYPRQGDKIDRDEDRFLFLEALLSARSRFIITYTGMSIKDNSLIPCSGVVSELKETIDQGFVLSQGRDIHSFHPLHPFDRKYYIDQIGRITSGTHQVGSLYRSYSKDNLNIAQSLANQNFAQSIFIQKDLIEKNLIEKDNELEPISISGNSTPDHMNSDTIDIDEIIRFYKHPLKTWVENGLNLQIPELSESYPDRELFSINGLDQYLLGTGLLEKAMDQKKTVDQTKGADWYPFFKATGQLPYGTKGRVEYERIWKEAHPVIEKAKAFLNTKALPALITQIDMAGMTICGNLSDIRENGRYSLNYGRLNGSRLVSAWIEHLFYNISAPAGYPQKTFLIGRDPLKKNPVVTYVFKDLGSNAFLYFEKLIQLFCQGNKNPVFLFCETAWQFVLSLSRKNFDTSRESIFEIMNQSKIKSTWLGNDFQTGEKQDRTILLCVENNDPFDSVDTLLASGFVKNALIVYQPLFENLALLENEENQS